MQIKENEKAEQMIQLVLYLAHRNSIKYVLCLIRCLCDANFNQPTSCAECFLPKPRLQEAGSPPDWVYDGFDVRPIIKLVALLDSRLVSASLPLPLSADVSFVQPSSPPAVSMSIVGTLRNLSVGHRSIRRYLRATVRVVQHCVPVVQSYCCCCRFSHHLVVLHNVLMKGSHSKAGTEYKCHIQMCLVATYVMYVLSVLYIVSNTD